LRVFASRGWQVASDVAAPRHDSPPSAAGPSGTAAKERRRHGGLPPAKRRCDGVVSRDHRSGGGPVPSESSAAPGTAAKHRFAGLRHREIGKSTIDLIWASELFCGASSTPTQWCRQCPEAAASAAPEMHAQANGGVDPCWRERTPAALIGLTGPL